MRKLVLVSLLAFVAMSQARAVVQMADLPECNTRTGDDTLCWQTALDAAVNRDREPAFGAVSAESGRRYVITRTLKVSDVRGGVINAHGAVLEWAGTDPDAPMFLFTNTQQLSIANLYIRSSAAAPLGTAFEFTKRAPASVAPRYNVLDHVVVDGTNLGGLKYGVRFTARYGLDEDNDQSTIMNSTFSNVSTAAISIEHSQSHDHRLVGVNASGAAGNSDGVFLQTKGGSFMSISGFHGNFRRANYYLESAPTPVIILDENSEGSAALLKTPPGVATFPLPVVILGGRFAVDDLQANGRVIEFYRHGPLSIHGLKLSGTNRHAGARTPTIYFHPTAIGEAGRSASLTVDGMLFAGVTPGQGSDGQDPIDVSDIVQVAARGNSCTLANLGVTACIGRAAGN